MSDFTPKDNSGAVFVNDRKEPGSQQPDRSGSALIGGVEYYVDGWLKKGAKGPFLSLAFKPKDAKAEKPKDRTGGMKDMPDDLIPF